MRNHPFAFGLAVSLPVGLAGMLIAGLLWMLENVLNYFWLTGLTS